ncbi:MAG: HEAT repeat protein [Bradymonadia bacterium]
MHWRAAELLLFFESVLGQLFVLPSRSTTRRKACARLLSSLTVLALLIISLGLPAPELEELRAQLTAQPLDMREAAETLAYAGPAGVEQLLAALQAGEGDRRVMLESLALAGPLPPVMEAIGAALDASDVPTRAAGASAAAALGEDALPFITKLRALLSVQGAEADAAAALAHLVDPVNVPALGALLGQVDSAVRSASLDALSTHGRYAAAHVQHIREALRGDPAPEVRVLAARALGRIGSGHPMVVQDLIAASQEPQVEVRAAARRALGLLGPRAVAALPALVAGLVDHEDDEARAVAAWALGRVGEGAQPAVPALVKATRDLSIAVVEQAIAAVARVGDSAAIDAAADSVKRREKMLSALAFRIKPPRPLPAAVRISLASVVIEFRLAAMRIVRPYADPEVLPTLIARLGDSDARNRKAAALALAMYGPAAAKARGALIQMMLDDVPAVAEAATHAVVALGPAGVPALEQALTRRRIKGRAWAVLALGRLDGKGAQTALREARTDADPRLRVAALAALLAIDPNDADALAGLVAALTGPDGLARTRAARAVAPQAKPEALLDALIAALDAPEVESRLAVISALRQTRNAAAGRALRRALSDSEDAVRIAAVRALPQHPNEARASVDRIARMLQDVDPRAGTIAARTLGRLGDAARPAISALIRVDDADVDRQVAASDALFAIAGEPDLAPQTRWESPPAPAPASAVTSAAPESAAPESAAPESAAPESAAPESAAPESAAPESAAPDRLK